MVLNAGRFAGGKGAERVRRRTRLLAPLVVTCRTRRLDVDQAANRVVDEGSTLCGSGDLLESLSNIRCKKKTECM